MSKKFIKSFAAFLLVLCMMLTNFGGWNHVLAEETSEDNALEHVSDEAKPSEDETEEPKEEPQDTANKDEADKTVEENTDETENDGLEISDEVKPEAVGAAAKPNVNKVFIGDQTVSGKLTMGAGQRKSKKIDFTIHVTVTRKAGGTEEKTVTILHTTSSQAWTVTLDSELAEGDKVTVKQEYGGDISEGVVLEVKKSLADQHKDDLKMPEGEIWIEQTSSNQVNDDEQAEAVQMLKDANTAIAGDIKSVKFSIDGTDHAYYEITYTDNSISGKIEATDLKIKAVTETSAAPTIEKVQVTDGQIVVTLDKEVAAGTKFYFVKNFTDGEDKNFCENGSCKVDKSNSQEMSQAVSIDGKKVTFQINAADDLELGREFGIVVKEPHKFRSCAKKEPVVTSPAKVEVRDARKLTDEDKKAIDKAIRDANTVKGASKLPDKFQGSPYPAIIEFDKDGNARIIDPNNVEVKEYDAEYNPVFAKNDDGTYKLKVGQKTAATFPVKDLVKNIKPDTPKVALSEDKKSITITPNEKDTDATIITVSYKDKDGKDQTTTATKADDGTWSITKGEGSVAQNGVITLPKNKVKGNTTVTAKVTDKGGVADDDKDPLTSDPGTLTVEETKADKVEALGGLDPVVMKKWVGDELDWKKGVKAKDDAKKSEVEELLKDAKFEDVTEEKRSTSKEGDFKGKIKITFDDKSELVVEKQMLYVSNLVTSGKRENTPDDALVVEFKLGEGTKVDNTGSGAIEGNKDNPTSYSNYKVKPNTNLKEYKIPVINASAVDSIKLSAQDGYTDPTWNTNNFVATSKNNVFTATATKTFKVKVVPNGGTGTEIEVTKKKDETYTLPAANTFTPPNENQKFSGWQIGDDTKNLKKAGDRIKITGDTEVKAIWKPIEYKVSFTTESGATGTMNPVDAKKGEYQLPEPTFKPDDGKEFAGWQVPGETEAKKAGDTINIKGDITLTATWKDIEYKVSFVAGDKSVKGNMDPVKVKKGEYELPSPTFTSDKVFLGWRVGNGSEVKKAGKTITISGDVTLTAVWEDKKEEVKVSFNHGDGASGEMEEKTVNKGSKYELPTPTFTPEEGKKFAGWKVGDSTELKQAKEKIDISGDVTLTAVWEDKPSNPGGNSGGYTPGGGGSIFTPSKPDKKPEDKKPGDEKPVDPNKPGEEKPNTPSEKNPEKPGEKEPGKEKDNNEEGKKAGVEDRLRIRYNPNGGHWNDNSTDILTYYYDRGNIITLINQPTREGYRFLYWKGSAYQPGDKYTVVDDHMFVAQWEKIGTKASRSNPKTGLESVAGIVCTLVGSTGALYISRKKED